MLQIDMDFIFVYFVCFLFDRFYLLLLLHSIHWNFSFLFGVFFVKKRKRENFFVTITNKKKILLRITVLKVEPQRKKFIYIFFFSFLVIRLFCYSYWIEQHKSHIILDNWRGIWMNVFYDRIKYTIFSFPLLSRVCVFFFSSYIYQTINLNKIMLRNAKENRQSIKRIKKKFANNG